MTSFIQCVNRKEEREGGREGCCKKTQNSLWSGQDRVRGGGGKAEGDYTFLAFNFEIPHFTSIPLFRSDATLTVKMSWLAGWMALPVHHRRRELDSISMPPLQRRMDSAH